MTKIEGEGRLGSGPVAALVSGHAKNPAYISNQALYSYNTTSQDHDVQPSLRNTNKPQRKLKGRVRKGSRSIHGQSHVHLSWEKGELPTGGTSERYTSLYFDQPSQRQLLSTTSATSSSISIYFASDLHQSRTHDTVLQVGIPKSNRAAINCRGAQDLHLRPATITVNMSNAQVGNVYQQIISDVIESSRVDFEEGGVDEHVLEELKQVCQHPIFRSSS